MTQVDGVRPLKAVFRSELIRDQSWAVHCVQERNVRDQVGNVPFRWPPSPSRFFISDISRSRYSSGSSVGSTVAGPIRTDRTFSRGQGRGTFPSHFNLTSCHCPSSPSPLVMHRLFTQQPLSASPVA